MSESGSVEAGVVNNAVKVGLYSNPNYTTLYRYENSTIPYDERREGVVSKAGMVGNWYTDDLSVLTTYTVTRIRGQRGGRFVGR